LPMALKLGLGTGGFRCQDWSCCCSEASTTCTIFRSNSPENRPKKLAYEKITGTVLNKILFERLFFRVKS
jgi:hypothetical protein